MFLKKKLFDSAKVANFDKEKENVALKNHMLQNAF
jgi:hypothetical protein